MTEDTTPDGLGGSDDDLGDGLIPAGAGWPKVVGFLAAAAIVVGGGVWGAASILGGAEEEASISPSTSTSAVPSISPSVSPSEDLAWEPGWDGGVAPGVVTVNAALPSALPMTDAVWETVGPGWVLAVYRPHYENVGGTICEGICAEVNDRTQVIYVVDPEGTRYQVLELDPSALIGIIRWDVENDEVLVRDRSDDPMSWVWLDLRTGMSRAFSPEIHPNAQRVGTTEDGHGFWVYAPWDDPSMATLFITDADSRLSATIPEFPNPYSGVFSASAVGGTFAWLADGILYFANIPTGNASQVPFTVPVGKTCEMRGPLDSSHALVMCQTTTGDYYEDLESSPYELGAQYLSVDLNDGSTTDLWSPGPEEELQFFGSLIVEGRLMGRASLGGEIACDEALAVWNGADFDLVEGIEHEATYIGLVSARGSVVYGAFTTGCDVPGAQTVFTLDLDTGVYTELLPVPADLGFGMWWDGATSLVVWP